MYSKSKHSRLLIIARRPFNAVGLLAFCSSLILLSCCAVQAQDNSGSKPLVTTESTSKNLTQDQIKTIVQLAEKCGLTNASKVNIFQYQPTGGTGISVISADRVDGRKIAHDELVL